MGRGVMVGGLMICGSFLLAASLNRSAVNESLPEDPAGSQAPLTPPLTAVHVDEPEPASCAADATSSEEPTAGDEPEQGDLPGNGPEACPQ
jgi:hypothetical protein